MHTRQERAKHSRNVADPMASSAPKVLFIFFCFFLKAELKHTQSAEGQRGFTRTRFLSHEREESQCAGSPNHPEICNSDFQQASQLIYNRSSQTQKSRIKTLQTHKAFMLTFSNQTVNFLHPLKRDFNPHDYNRDI